MGKGRKRKNGARTKSGRLSRAKVHTHDRGTERAQMMQAVYGTDGSDAIGRAFRTGLLGDGSDAKAMLDMARSIFNAYWAAYEEHPFTSPIADKTGGSTPALSSEAASKREKWLNVQLDAVKAKGYVKRRAFMQLVIDPNPDSGPLWLDRLCFAHRSPRMMIEPMDAQCLEWALEALATVANVDMPRVVRLKAA